MKLKNIKFILIIITILGSIFFRNDLIKGSSVNKNEITDQNGILLDIARCPLSKQEIEKVINQIDSKKFSYVILHLNDDEHVAFQAKILKNKGSKNVLSKKDLKEITKDANQHGLTLIPDFDTPGHCKALIKLLKKHNPKLAREICLNSNTLNYTKSATIKFIKQINNELSSACANQNTRYILLGGDEVAANENNNHALIKYFNELNAFENRYDFQTIIWNDSILKNNNLNNKIVVAYWAQGGGNTSKKILQKEYDNRANVTNLIDHPLINANAGYNYFNLDNLGNLDYITNFINQLNSSTERNFDLINPQTLTNDPDCYQGKVKSNGRLICLWGDKNSKIKINQLLYLIKKINTMQ